MAIQQFQINEKSTNGTPKLRRIKKYGRGDLETVIDNF